MRRAGFVLAGALVAMVIIALLITGAFFASGQELGVARNELRDQQALAFAEDAASRAIDSWDAVARAPMRVGETVRLPATSSASLESTVFVTRFDTALYAVVGEARCVAGDGYGLRRRVGVVVRTMRDGAPLSPPLRVTEQAWTELY